MEKVDPALKKLKEKECLSLPDWQSQPQPGDLVATLG